MSEQIIKTVDARYNTNTNVGGDLYNHNVNNINNYTTVVQAEPTSKPLSPPPFNDAPIDLLSTHFSDREEELERLARVLGVGHRDNENIPSRCVVYGIPGQGKTQLALQYTKLSSDLLRYRFIFWISGATVEKLNQGFAKVLNLVGHPERLLQEQSARLTAARRWMEESKADDSMTWLVVFDNVARDTLDFLRDHLPRKNPRGSILFTTRTEDFARELANAAGKQHEVFELRAPSLHDAAMLLLEDADVDTSTVASSIKNKAELLVKCVGCLPLAVVQAASFMKQSHKTLDDLLELYQTEKKIEVGWNHMLTPDTFRLN
jgi:hypothetical protein